MVQHFKHNFDYEFLRNIDRKGHILADEEYECNFLKINVRYIFRQHLNLKILVVDIINLVDKYVKYNKHQQLKQFIFNYVNQLNYSNVFYPKWNHTIYVAIQIGDIESLEFLWGLAYFYGSNTWFLSHLYYAAQHGNLKIFQHILYAYSNYMKHEYEGISIRTLKDLALQNNNKTVKNFINSLFDGIPQLLKDKDTFYGCSNGVIQDCQNELRSRNSNDDYYTYQENHLKIATLYFNNLNKFIHQ